MEVVGFGCCFFGKPRNRTQLGKLTTSRRGVGGSHAGAASETCGLSYSEVEGGHGNAGFGVQGLGCFGGLGFRVQGLGFRVSGNCRLQHPQDPSTPNPKTLNTITTDKRQTHKSQASRSQFNVARPSVYG